MSTAPAVAMPSKTPPPPKFVASQLLEISSIEPDPHNIRKDFPKEAMNELISSVMLHGVREPIEVRPVAGGKNRIVFGERRYRAAKAAGHKDIPAMVRQLTDIDAADIQLEENLKRANLSPLEVAGGYQRQLDLGRTMDQLCERAGRKRTQVYAMLNLLKLGDEGRKALGEEQIEVSTAQLVASWPKSMQGKALSIVKGVSHFGEALSYRDAKTALERELMIDLRKAPFDVKTEGIPCVAKSCAVCVHCVRNHPELEDVQNKDACLSGTDYRAKVFADAKTSIEAKGWKMMKPEQAEGLFYNGGAGAVDPKSGLIETSEHCFDDTQNRPYKELLTTEQLKKLVKVAVDSNARPRQLLERASLMREVKKGGVIKLRKKNAAPSPSRSSSSSSPAPKKEDPARYRDPPPSMEDLVERAGTARLIEAVEKKGLTPALLKEIVIKAISKTDCFGQARGLPHNWAWGIEHKPGDFEKAFPKATPAKLAGLLYEAIVIDDARMNNDVDELLKGNGIEQKKLRADIEKANPVRWSEDQHGATGAGLKGAEYVIEKKGKAFVFKKPKEAGDLTFDTLEKAKACAARVELGQAVWKPEAEDALRPNYGKKMELPVRGATNSKLKTAKKGGGK